MNLPGLVKDHFSGDTTLDLADTMAQSPQHVGLAISSAVPLFLAAIAHRISDADGPAAVAQAVRERDPAILDRFHDLVESGQLNSLTDTGSHTLAGLLGQNNVDVIANAISQAHGLSFPSSRWLLSLIAAVGLAVIHRHAPDASPQGISELFRFNASAISSAIPENLRGRLATIPYLDRVTHAPYDQGVAATSFDDAMHDESELHRQEFVPALHGAPDRPSAASWSVPIVILVAVIAGVVWVVWPRYTPNSVPPPIQPMPQSVGQSTPEPNARPAGSRIPSAPGNQPNSAIGGMSNRAAAMLSSGEVLGGLGPVSTSPEGQQLADIFDRLAGTIQDIHDRVSAEAAVPALERINQQLDQTPTLLSRLPADSQSKLRGALAKAAPNVGKAIDTIANIPGVNEQVRPITNQIAQTLTSIASTP